MSKKVKIFFIALIVFLLYRGYLNLKNEIISLNDQIVNNNLRLSEIQSQLHQLKEGNKSILMKKDISFNNLNIENNTVECTVSLTLKRSFNNSKVLINVNGIEKNTELENGSYIYRDVLPINSNLKLGLLSICNESVKEVENLNYEASVLNTVLGECYINVPWEYSFFEEKDKGDVFEMEFDGGIYTTFQGEWRKIPKKIDFVLLVNDREKYRHSIIPTDKGTNYMRGDIKSRKYKFLKNDRVLVNFEVEDEHGYIHVIPKLYRVIGDKDSSNKIELIQTVKDKNGNLI